MDGSLLASEELAEPVLSQEQGDRNASLVAPSHARERNYPRTDPTGDVSMTGEKFVLG